LDDNDRATSVEPDESALPMSLSTGCGVDVIGHKQPMKQASVTDGNELESRLDQHQRDEGDQLDCIATHADMNTSDVEERGKPLSPLSFSNTVTESDFDAVIPSSCMSVSHGSDSGIYSKAVSDGLATLQSTMTEPADLCQSTADRSPDLSALAVPDTEIKNDVSDDESQNNDPRHQRVCESLLPSTEVVQSTCLDTEEENTLVDVRSSIMSTNTDDEINQNVVGADEQMLSESLHTLVASAASDEEVGQSAVNYVCLPADWHVSCLGSQEFSGVSDSDDEYAVMKTVVAVRTKAVDHTEFVDSIKSFEPDEKSDIVETQNDSVCIHSSLGEIRVESMEERLLCGHLNQDSSLPECSNLQPVNVNDRTVKSLQAKTNGTDTEGNSIAVDPVDNGNCVTLAAEIPARTDEQLSTLSTDLDQYMTECTLPATDTSFDSQTLNAAANDSRQLSDLIASVKIFSEDDELRIDGAGRLSHSRTRSFTNADYSLPSSRSCSPEIPSKNEIRRHSCTPSTPQPPDVVERVCGSSLEHQGRESWQDDEIVTSPQITLTASIEDLKLRPSKKKLEFDGLPNEPSQPFLLEPPDEYRDHPITTENDGSSISPNVTDLSTNAYRPPVSSELQAKEDHLQRYLKSLATMPGYDSVHDVTDSDLLHESRINSHDVSYNCRFDREDVLDLPRHECSTSLLIPDLLHQSDNVEEFTEDDYLEVQLQQYEVMKRRLMDEHRRSLEHLLAEQERQMSLLQSRLMGQTMSSRSSHHTGTMTHATSTLATANSDFEHRKSNVLPSDVPDTLDRQRLSNEIQITSHTVGLDQQKILSPDHRVAAVVADETLSCHKKRSPAGVFYNDQQVISREPSCSTIRSDDAESEFAYQSPAVLRSSRRRTPVCSPRDTSQTQLELMHHSLMPNHNGHPYSSTGPMHSPQHVHRLNRRYVDMFSEASIKDCFPSFHFCIIKRTFVTVWCNNNYNNYNNNTCTFKSE